METWYSQFLFFFSFPETCLGPKLFLAFSATLRGQKAIVTCPVSKPPAQGGWSRGPPARAVLRALGMGFMPAALASGASLQPGGWGSHMRAKGKGLSLHPFDGKGAQMSLRPSHRRKKAPVGQKSSLQTDTAAPNADSLLIWNSLPTLKSKRKNKLYMPGEKILPVSWTIAYTICLFQEKQ